MGRHLENFVCIFLFISIWDFAPHNYKQLIVRNVCLGKAKLHLNSLVVLFACLEHWTSQSSLKRNFWSVAALGSLRRWMDFVLFKLQSCNHWAVKLTENWTSPGGFKDEHTNQGMSHTTSTLCNSNWRLFSLPSVLCFLFVFSCHTAVLI